MTKFKPKPSDPVDKIVQIRISRHQHEQVKALAEESGLTIYQLLQQMVAHCLDDQGPQTKEVK